MKSSMRIVNILLVICSITFPTSVVLLGYILYTNHEITILKSTLLSKNALQIELLNGQKLEQSLIPHLVDEIGFVLNPYVKRSSFKSAEGESYAVNSLGLRGREINKKKTGVIRILIVGDSVVFGWKLNDKDRLSSQLEKYTSEINTSQKKVEFFTIALPGWNVRSERAFLESHLSLLDPDVILWSSIPNDMEDVAGVVPPGLLVSWASPHDRHQSPFTGLSPLHKRSGPFMPFILEKQFINIELIASFKKKYDIPILLIGLPGLNEHKQASVFEGQQIFVPRKYIDDGRWRLSSTDGHPTSWANKIYALGILDKLIRLKFIPEIEFTVKDKTIIQDFRKSEVLFSGQQKKPSDFTKALARIPTEYTFEKGILSDSVLYGVSHNGFMNKAGTLFLRDINHSAYLILTIESITNINKYSGNVVFTVRNRAFETTNTSVKINAKQMDIRLPIPIDNTNFSVYEISWKYDFLNCWGPSNCASGKLIQAKFEKIISQ